jgi:hypothetical protein
MSMIRIKPIYTLIPFIKNKFVNLTRRKDQFFYQEKTTIAEWQGARKEEKFVAKPTQSNRKLFLIHGIIYALLPTYLRKMS